MTINPSVFVCPINLLIRREAQLFMRALALPFGVPPAFGVPPLGGPGAGSEPPKGGTPNGNPSAERVVEGLWAYWGSQQKVWQPLGSPVPDVLTVAWCAHDDTLQLIELGVGWSGHRGGLTYIALECGYLRIVKDGDVAGVELCGFGELNEHFRPNYKSGHQKGAAGAAEAKRRKHDGRLAEQQRELLEKQQSLQFEATREEVEGAVILIMQLDRLAGRKTRLTLEYEPKLVEQAVFVRRNFTPARIESMLAWLLHQRDDRTVLQGAEHVLGGWEQLIGRAGL